MTEVGFQEAREQKSQSKTLRKAVRVLDSYSLDNPEWGIRELARHLDMSPTTVYRLVATLHAAGLLEQDEETQRYSLGPKTMKLASIYARVNPLPDIAERIFEEYSSRFEYNFYLGKLNNFEVVYLAVLDGRGPVKIVVEPGGSISLSSTALGKALLAYQDQEFVDAYLANTTLTRYTERTIADPELLRAHLHQVRDQGYAINDGEHYDAVGAVGVPILSEDGAAELGVSLAYPRHWLASVEVPIEELVELAKEIAEKISLRTELS